MASIEELRKVRLEKLHTLREKGIDPYPAHIKRTHTIETVTQNFDTLAENEETIFDKNGDNIDDLTLSFNLQDMQIKEGTQEICLSGKDEWGTIIKGCDAVEFTSNSSW